jgi:hypothetical protein
MSHSTADNSALLKDIADKFTLLERTFRAANLANVGFSTYDYFIIHRCPSDWIYIFDDKSTIFNLFPLEQLTSPLPSMRQPSPNPSSKTHSQPSFTKPQLLALSLFHSALKTCLFCRCHPFHAPLSSISLTARPTLLSSWCSLPWTDLLVFDLTVEFKAD